MADPKTSGAGTSSTTATRPARPKSELLPPWKVLLHNDDVNDMDFVIDTIVELTTPNRHAATGSNSSIAPISAWSRRRHCAVGARLFHPLRSPNNHT